MIFVDAGPLIARSLVRDSYHELARRSWDLIDGLPVRLLTSNLVLSEVFTFIARRSSYAFAAERAKAVLESRAFEILRPEREDEAAALGYFEKYADQRVSFTDCVSFALMRRWNVRRAFTSAIATSRSPASRSGHPRWLPCTSRRPRPGPLRCSNLRLSAQL